MADQEQLDNQQPGSDADQPQSANSVNPRPKKAPTRGSYKPGQSGNPAGAPPRGQSWADIFNEVGSLTPEAAAKQVSRWAAKFRLLPQGVTLKYIVAIRAFTALIDEPNARLIMAIMDRMDGKVVEKHEFSGSLTVEGLQDELRKVWGAVQGG